MLCDVFLVLAFPLWKIVNCLQNLSEGWSNASPQLNQSAQTVKKEGQDS